jgi:hypothetical protein
MFMVNLPTKFPMSTSNVLQVIAEILKLNTHFKQLPFCCFSFFKIIFCFSNTYYHTSFQDPAITDYMKLRITNFHEYQSPSSGVERPHTHHGDLISLLSFLEKEG